MLFTGFLLRPGEVTANRRVNGVLREPSPANVPKTGGVRQTMGECGRAKARGADRALTPQRVRDEDSLSLLPCPIIPSLSGSFDA
jgi:hypothetical protein